MTPVLAELAGGIGWRPGVALGIPTSVTPVRNRVLSGDKGCASGRGLLTVEVGERTSFLGDARMGGNAFTCETPLMPRLA